MQPVFLTLACLILLLFAPYFSIAVAVGLITIMTFGMNINSFLLCVVWFCLWFHFTNKDKNQAEHTSDLIGDLLDRR